MPDPDWAAQDHYRMLSITFVVRSMDLAFAEGLRWHLDPFRLPSNTSAAAPFDLRVDGDDGSPAYSFSMSGELKIRDHSVSEVFAYAVWAIHAMVPNTAEDFLCLHSGAVGRDGRALLVPARMEIGKSSLTLALLQRGFSYLSDEVGALDVETGEATPFPKLITLEQRALRFFPGVEDMLEDRGQLSDQLPERFVRPGDVGATNAAAAPVGWLVFPSSTWEGPPRLLPVSRSEAVELMARNCFNLYRFQDLGVLLLARIASEAEAFRLEGGDPGERAELLAERLA